MILGTLSINAMNSVVAALLKTRPSKMKLSFESLLSLLCNKLRSIIWVYLVSEKTLVNVSVLNNYVFDNVVVSTDNNDL